ncbi:MAG: HPF/RaiA family ribosome-associated protein [Holophaga sp.]
MLAVKAQSPRPCLRTFGLAAEEPTQTYLRDRVRCKFRKFLGHIRSLEVRLWGEGGYRGEALAACIVSLALGTNGLLVVERFAGDPQDALDHALGVAERSLRRRLQRARHS